MCSDLKALLPGKTRCAANLLLSTCADITNWSRTSTNRPCHCVRFFIQAQTKLQWHSQGAMLA